MSLDIRNKVVELIHGLWVKKIAVTEKLVKKLDNVLKDNEDFKSVIEEVMKANGFKKNLLGSIKED